MAEVQTAPAAVGTEPRTLEIWPAIPAGYWEVIKPVLLSSMGALANRDTELDLDAAVTHEIDENLLHSAVSIPVELLDEESGQGPNLINYAGVLAKHLDLKQLRYGMRATTHKTSFLVGFSDPLTAQEAEVCRAHGLWQVEGGRPVEELPVQDDGSQTVHYRGRFRSEVPRLERIRKIHAHVIKDIAPQLEEGVIVTPIVVGVKERGYPTLFTRPQAGAA